VLLETTGNYLASAPLFSVYAEVTFEEFLGSGQKTQPSRTVDVMVN
jgi:hypothetical protein